jgi:hypothetical protein
VNNNGGGIDRGSNNRHYGLHDEPLDKPRVRLHYKQPVNNNGGGYNGPQGHNQPEDHEHYGQQVNQRVPGAAATAAVVYDTTAGQKWRKECLFSARPKVHLVFPKHTAVPVAAAASVAVSTTVDQQEPPKEPPSSLFFARKVYVVFPKTSLVPVAAAASVAVRTTVDQEWPEEPIDGVTIVTASQFPALQLRTRHIQVTLSGLGLGFRYKPTLSL